MSIIAPLKKIYIYIYIYIFFFFFVVPLSLQEFSSWTRDRTQALLGRVLTTGAPGILLKFKKKIILFIYF